MNKPNKEEYSTCFYQAKLGSDLLISAANKFRLVKHGILTKDDITLDIIAYVDSTIARLGCLLESNKNKTGDREVYSLWSFRGIGLSKEIDSLIERAKNRYSNSNGLKAFRDKMIAHCAASANHDRVKWLSTIKRDIPMEIALVLLDITRSLILINENLHYDDGWEQTLRQCRTNLVILKKDINSGKL